MLPGPSRGPPPMLPPDDGSAAGRGLPPRDWDGRDNHGGPLPPPSDRMPPPGRDRERENGRPPSQSGHNLPPPSGPQGEDSFGRLPSRGEPLPPGGRGERPEPSWMPPPQQQPPLPPEEDQFGRQRPPRGFGGRPGGGGGVFCRAPSSSGGDRRGGGGNGGGAPSGPHNSLLMSGRFIPGGGSDNNNNHPPGINATEDKRPGSPGRGAINATLGCLQHHHFIPDALCLLQTKFLEALSSSSLAILAFVLFLFSTYRVISSFTLPLLLHVRLLCSLSLHRK